MVTFLRALLLGVLIFFGVLFSWDFVNPSIDGVKTNPYRASLIEFKTGQFLPNTYFFFPNPHDSVEANDSQGKSTSNKKNLNSSLQAVIYSDNQENKASSNKVIVIEGGSSPAGAITLARIPSPIPRLIYELNKTIPFYDSGNIYLSWKIKNETSEEIVLTDEVKKQLNPAKLRVTDFASSKSFPIKFDGQIPVANCLLNNSIPPHGRIDCNAIAGPVFSDIPGVQDNRVFVKLPGSPKSVPVFVTL